MIIIRVLAMSLIVSLIPFSSAYTVSASTETIEISKRAGNYEITVPISHLLLMIPQRGLLQSKNTQGGGADNPRYFIFEDKSLHLTISGWIEPAQGYPGLKVFWKDETTEWKRGGLPDPQYVVFTKIANWESILYDLPVPKGNNSHLRANWLQSGTWIDIHLSMSSDKPSSEIRASLQSLLKEIQITEKISRENGIRKYLLPDHGSLQLAVTPSWKDELRQPPDRLPPTIVLGQGTGAPFQVLITPLWPKNIEAALPNVDALKREVRATADEMKSHAVEKVIDIKELKGINSFGYYFTLTDRAPKAGEFKYMTQGALRIGNLMVVFTVLTNDGQSKIVEDALIMMQSAKHIYPLGT